MACAPTIGPATPPVEVLVVLDSTDDTLRIIPVDTPGVVHHLLLSPNSSVATALALHGQIAAIGLGQGTSRDPDRIMVLDLGLHQVVCTQPLSGKGPVGAVTFTDGGQAYTATPTTDSVAFIDVPSGCGVNQGSIAGGPQGFGIGRQTVFAVVGNRKNCRPVTVQCPESPSWLRIIPQPVRPTDSIPLLGPGNAMGAVFASDGFLYITNAGNGNPDGILSQVDPLSHRVVSYGGFGHLPEFIATDGADHVYVASPIDGLMVFNVRTHQPDRDVNSAVQLNGTARGLAVDDVGRIYALVTGGCPAGAAGSVRVLGPDLVQQHNITVGRCPVAVGVTEIPAALYRFN